VGRRLLYSMHCKDRKKRKAFSHVAKASSSSSSSSSFFYGKNFFLFRGTPPISSACL